MCNVHHLRVVWNLLSSQVEVSTKERKRNDATDGRPEEKCLREFDSMTRVLPEYNVGILRCVITGLGRWDHVGEKCMARDHKVNIT